MARNGAGGVVRGPKSEVRDRRCRPGCIHGEIACRESSPPVLPRRDKRRGGLQPIQRPKIAQNGPKTAKNGILGRFGGSGGLKTAQNRLKTVNFGSGKPKSSLTEARSHGGENGDSNRNFVALCLCARRIGGRSLGFSHTKTRRLEGWVLDCGSEL